MILILAEKPSAAKRIAYSLSEKEVKIEKYKGVVVYKIFVDGKEGVVVPAVGHLMTLREKNKSFEYPTFDIEWAPINEVDKGAKHAKKFIETIKHYGQNAEEIIVACDYDIEGELIGKNIITMILGKKDAERMKFSTLTKEELKKSFKERMKNIDWGQANAGEARHIMDWLYGINLSRALIHSSKKGGQYNILSIGRLQGPALKIVVEREKEIEEFKPEKYYELWADLEKIKAIYEKNRLSKGEAEEIYERIKNKKKGSVEEVKEKESLIKPPPAFDLTTLQTEAYRIYRYSPARTLAIAQELYLAGMISYPRTSSQKLPSTINYNKILKKISEKYAFAKKLIGKKPVQGKKDDPAHPAIYPTGLFTKSLKREELNIYDLIVRRFLSAFSEPVIRHTVEAKIRIGEKKDMFVVKGTYTVAKGWSEIYPLKLKEESFEIKKGDILNVKKIWIEEKETQPPKRYTQAGLVKELEKRNLGTKATRAAIVKTLYDRGYIKEDPIKPTILGKELINILSKYSPDILDENLTRQFEEEMEKIRQKTLTVEEVVKKAKDVLKKILEDFKKKEKKIGEGLVDAHREEQKITNEIGDCPLCKKGKLMIRYTKEKKRFIGCSNYPECKFTAPLPQKGKIKSTNKKCKYCGFPLIKIYSKKRWIEICINPECPGKKEKEKKMNEQLKSQYNVYEENGNRFVNKQCPKCGGRLLVKKGPYGYFLACENWPKCKYTEGIEKSKSESKTKKKE